MIASTALTSCASAWRRPARTSASASSAAWLSASSRGKFEEAAIALHRVDEAEDAIEPRAVVGLGFPGDDLAAQGFEHFAAFGYEIGNQVIHRLRHAAPQALLSQGLMPGRS